MSTIRSTLFDVHRQSTPYLVLLWYRLVRGALGPKGIMPPFCPLLLSSFSCKKLPRLSISKRILTSRIALQLSLTHHPPLHPLLPQQYNFGSTGNGESTLTGLGESINVRTSGGYQVVTDARDDPVFIVSYHAFRREFAIRLARDPHMTLFIRCVRISTSMIRVKRMDIGIRFAACRPNAQDVSAYFCDFQA